MESVQAELDVWAGNLFQGLERVSTLYRIGNSAREMVRLADKQSVDLIVVGTRDRTGLAQVLLGSGTEHVLKMANCPVLIVRATGEPEKMSHHGID